MNPNKFLELIADGYFHDIQGNRYVVINNPKYKDGTIDGESEDAFLVWDTWEGELA